MSNRAMARKNGGAQTRNKTSNDVLQTWMDWFNEPAWLHTFNVAAVDLCETGKANNSLLLRLALRKRH